MGPFFGRFLLLAGPEGYSRKTSKFRLDVSAGLWNPRHISPALAIERRGDRIDGSLV
ncbi:MAG: hypothetical protein M3270_04720 [Thermoproteota archaeon]|nr:hypothetical protein [Thermoproteota archaeon]